jgi:uncharacterized protein with PIN domain
MNNPSFIADSMLGSLAKWLRMMGFDTLYFKDIADNELVRIAKQERRIILTRDAILAKSRKCADCIVLKSNEISGQLKEVLTIFPMESKPRCAKCNGELEPADKRSVAGDVPEHVFLNIDSFLRCVDCGKVYWEGSHKKAIDETIRNLLDD